MAAGKTVAPFAKTCLEAGTDHAVGMAMEESGEPSSVTSDALPGGVGAIPSSVIASLSVGGVNSPTSVAAAPPSGARQFEQLAAPGGFRLVQWGQSITGSNAFFLVALRLCVSSQESKDCGGF